MDLDRDYYMTAQQAMELQLIDEILVKPTPALKPRNNMQPIPAKAGIQELTC